MRRSILQALASRAAWIASRVSNAVTPSRRAALAISFIGFLVDTNGVHAATDESCRTANGSGLQHIPFSRFASPEAHRLWLERERVAALWNQWRVSPEAIGLQLDPLHLRAHWLRKWGDHEYLPVLTVKQRARYKVRIEQHTMGGVYTEIFTPSEGIPPKNQHRVLINLHGGAFVAGSRVGGQVESIPIAAVAKMKVISIDYRQAPEHAFPAASEDVAAIYRALLDTHRPETIGIYGCSAGAMLVAQSIAHFVQIGLPRPGAAGMLCGTGEILGTGDGAFFAAALDGLPLEAAEQRQADNLYLRRADPQDPAAFPMRHPEILQLFPPSILVSGTRSYELSSIAHANTQLALAGVATEFYVWDGVHHGFLYDPDLPESRQAYSLIAAFFDRHLGPAGRGKGGR